MLFSSAGCGRSNRRAESEALAAWREVYAALEADGESSKPAAKSDGIVECRVEGMAAGDFVRWLSGKTGLAITIALDLAEKPVTFDASDLPENVLHLFARHLDVGVSRIGRSYYVGVPTEQDRGLMVRRMGRLKAEEIRELMTTVGSGQGKVQVFADGLFVMVDHLLALRRIDEACDAVEAATVPTWIVQYYLVRDQDNEDWTFNVGADFDASLRLARVAATAGGDNTNEVSDAMRSLNKLGYDFNAWLTARGASGKGAVRQSPLMIVVDGEAASIHVGKTVPVPKKAISNEGTATTTEYVQYRDGLQLECTIRESRGGGGVLDVKMSLSNITGYVGDAPIMTEDTLKTRAGIQSGGVYLLGALTGSSRTEEKTGFLSWGRSKRDSTEKLEVWARVYRINGAANGGAS